MTGRMSDQVIVDMPLEDPGNPPCAPIYTPLQINSKSIQISIYFFYAIIKMGIFFNTYSPENDPDPSVESTQLEEFTEVGLLCFENYGHL